MTTRRTLPALLAAWAAVLLACAGAGTQPRPAPLPTPAAPDVPAGDVLGVWDDDGIPKAERVTTLVRQGGKLTMHRKFRDGSGGTTEVVEKAEGGKTRYMAADRQGPRNDYWVIDGKGDLEVWSWDPDTGRHGLLYTAKRLK